MLWKSQVIQSGDCDCEETEADKLVDMKGEMRENIGDDGDDVEKMYESERASKTCFFFKVPKGTTPRIFLDIFDSFLILRMHN